MKKLFSPDPTRIGRPDGPPADGALPEVLPEALSEALLDGTPVPLKTAQENLPFRFSQGLEPVQVQASSNARTLSSSIQPCRHQPQNL